MEPTASLPPSDVTKTSPPLTAFDPAALLAAPSITGRYRLMEEIARGGMGVVHRAYDTQFDREVALKLIHEKYKDDDGIRQRFLEEARITGQLQHPGIPPVQELGTLPDGRPFLAMKLIKGKTLERLLKEDNPNAGQKLAIFEGVCQALAYAHSKNVIHRDLKPANIMVGAFGETQVMDWGLAKVLGISADAPNDAPAGTVLKNPRSGDSSDQSTQAGSAIGTYAYMPPEQAVGAKHLIGTHSDVFGLGAVLCELLTGKPPYVRTGEDPTNYLAATGKLDDAYARIDAADADAELKALCKRSLNADVKKRPASAGALLAEVEQFVQATEERAKQAEVKAAKAAQRRKFLMGLAAVLLAGVGASLYLAYHAGLSETKAIKETEDRHRAEANEQFAKTQTARAEEALLKEAQTRGQLEEGKRELDRSISSLSMVSQFAADSAFAESRIARANEFLSQVPRNMRGWEWSRRKRAFNGSYATLYGHVAKVLCVAFSPDAKLIASGSEDKSVKLWDGCTGLEVATLDGHKASVDVVAFSPDGKWLASGSRDSATAIIWNLQSRKVHRHLQIGREEAASTLIFSPDSARLASLSMGGAITLWDATSGGRLRVIEYKPRDIADGTSNPGKLIEAFEDGGGTIFNSFNELPGPPRRLKGRPFNDLVNEIMQPEGVSKAKSAFKSLDELVDELFANQDPPLIALGPKPQNDNSRQIPKASISNADSQKGKTLDDLVDEITKPTVSNDSSHKGKSLDDLVNEITKPIGSSGVQTASEKCRHPLIFVSDRDLRCSYKDGHVVTWDIHNGEESARHPLRMRAASEISFSPDMEAIAILANDSNIYIHNIENNSQYPVTIPSRNATAIAFQPDGSVLAIGQRDGTIEICDTNAPAAQRSLRGHTGEVNAIAFSPDAKRLVSCSSDQTLKLWDLTVTNEAATILGHVSPVTSASFSPDGLFIASTSRDRTLQITDASTFSELRHWQAHEDAGTCVAVSRNSGTVVSGSQDKSIKLWDVKTGTLRATLKGHVARLTALEFLPGSTKLVSASHDGNIRIWDPSNGMELGSFNISAQLGKEVLAESFPGIPSFGIDVSADGKQVVAAIGDGEIGFWDLDTCRLMRRYKIAVKRVASLACSKDGKMFAIGDMLGGIEVHNTVDGGHVVSLGGHSDETSTLAFAPDGGRLASGCADGAVKLWHIETGTELLALRGHDKLVSCVRFSPDGTRLISCSWDKSIMVWDASPTNEALHPQNLDWMAVLGRRNAAEGLWVHPEGSRKVVIELRLSERELAFRRGKALPFGDVLYRYYREAKSHSAKQF